MSDGPQKTSDPPAIRYLEGDLIQGKYRLTHPIGEGGMGVVWAAHNVALNVDVAIKLIHKVTGDPESGSRRLLQEARTAAQLAHPAICRVFDYGQTERSDPFIVCELLSGESLGAHLDNHGPMSAAKAIQAILPVVDGLSVAHALGIVHCDVKSDNIFLSEGIAGRIQPKLLDFGIARSIHNREKLAVDGAVLGTPNYMSPEQARGDTDHDSRTDIWSLCIVIYELVTGTTPFEDENYNAVLWSILNEQPRSTLECGAGDEALWQILEKGLRKDPDERWLSMRELGGALAGWLSVHGLSADVCGASLRATWLDIDGARASFVSIAPESRPSFARLTPEARASLHRLTPEARVSLHRLTPAARASLHRLTPETHIPSANSPSRHSSSRRYQHRAFRSSDCTLPGVARTAVRRMGARRLTPIALGTAGLCLAVLATWLLGARAQPDRVEPGLSASIRIASTSVAKALPPVVSVEDLAVELGSAGANGSPDAGAADGQTRETSTGVPPSTRNAEDRSRSAGSVSVRRKKSGPVNFGF